jgi:hypothetical protein
MRNGGFFPHFEKSLLFSFDATRSLDERHVVTWVASAA